MEYKEAIEKGYLENKKITLMPSPRGERMGIKNKEHVGYFIHNGCSVYFTLKRMERGDLVNPFKSIEERQFFESVLGIDLSTTKEGNYFEKELVKITKQDAGFLDKGVQFDMSNPIDNLRARIIMSNIDLIAPSFEKRKDQNSYKWYIIDSSKANKAAEEEFDSVQNFWMAIGRHCSTESDKRLMLKIYLGTISSSKVISHDTSEAMLSKELKEIGDDADKRKKFMLMIEDKSLPIKKLIISALQYKLISKEGVDSYVITGEEKTYAFNELARFLQESKDENEDVYFKLVAQLDKLKNESK